MGIKKIGLLTFHDTANHGAALQAFATLKAIDRMGYSAEIIDYTNEFRSSLYNLPNKIKFEFRNKKYKELIKSIFGSILIIKRMKQFNKFYSLYTKRSLKTYRNNQDANEIESSYSSVVVGSDQVWSLTNNGYDSNYFLNFVKDKSKTLSYASSFGTTSLNDKNIQDYSQILASIRNISVRETTGKNIVKKLTGQHATVVLDPVFLLSSDEWLDLVSKKYPIEKMKHDRFLDYTSKKSFLDSFMKIDGLRNTLGDCYKYGTSFKIVDLFNSKCHIQFNSDPIDFIHDLYHSSLLFTSSFHGVVLSIIFRKKFIVALSGNEGRDSRIVDLLKLLELESRIFNSNMTLDDINIDVDYDVVHTKLDILKKQSLTYLEKSLSKVEQ